MLAKCLPLFVSIIASFATVGPALCQDPATSAAVSRADLPADPEGARGLSVSVDGEQVTVHFAEGTGGTTMLRFAEDVGALTGIEICCDDDAGGQVIHLTGDRSLERDQLFVYFLEVVRNEGACVVQYGSLGTPYGDGPVNGYLRVRRTAGIAERPMRCFVRRLVPVVAPSDLPDFQNDDTVLTTAFGLKERDAQAMVDLIQAGLPDAIDSCRAVRQSNAVVVTGLGRALFALRGVIDLAEGCDALFVRRLSADGSDVIDWAAAVEAAREADPTRSARVVADPEDGALAVFAPEAELDAACAWAMTHRPASQATSDGP